MSPGFYRALGPISLCRVIGLLNVTFHIVAQVYRIGYLYYRFRIAYIIPVYKLSYIHLHLIIQHIDRTLCVE